MPETAYHLTVGDYKCVIVNDGCIVDPAETYGLNCIYIESGKNKMLVDNGGGEMLQHTAGHLAENLKAEGIKRGDITTIIFDHGHVDHVCGTFDEKGNPAFPSARYIISRKEWEYIESPPGSDEMQNNLFAPARRYLTPLKERFQLVDDTYEILPGIKLTPAHGHTPGNSMVDISSNGERLLCIGDIIHSQREFTEPAHCAAFDAAPEEAIKTRERILKQLAKDGTFVFATHFPFPGLGYIREKNGALSWEPF